MYNRYVDGLATWQPKEREAYREMGETLAHEGYLRPGQPSSREVALRRRDLMAHIKLTDGLPGIRGPMVFSPETTKPLETLAPICLTSFVGSLPIRSAQS
jgi:hypothetical protein